MDMEEDSYAKYNEEEDDDDDDEEEDDWEEVPMLMSTEEGVKDGNGIPEGGLVITVPRGDGLSFSQRKKGLSPDDLLRLRLNKRMRERQVVLHKVHLLCCISRGLLLNEMINRDEFKALAVSRMSANYLSSEWKPDLATLRYTLKWFRFEYCSGNKSGSSGGDDGFCDEQSIAELEEEFKKYFVYEGKPQYVQKFLHRVLLFVIFARAVGLDSRFVWSLQPIPLKPMAEDVLKKQSEPRKKPNNGSTSSAIEKNTTKKAASKSKAKIGDKEDSSNDDDEEDWVKSKSQPKRRRAPAKKTAKPKSSSIAANYWGKDYWAEVYVPSLKTWVCVDVDQGPAGVVPASLEEKASKPLLYVLSFDNQGAVKDVTRRYANKWLTQTMRSRVDTEWWEDAIESFLGQDSPKDRAEDKELELSVKRTVSAPISNVADLKNHPIYALSKDLKKYEALFPPNVQPSGIVKGYPYYLREHVKTLHTREVWKRDAKVVRIGEEPYKLVKGRPKMNGEIGSVAPNDTLTELFGEWQVTNYIPPIARNGKVPRNEYGGVDLFKPEMLPGNTMHLPIPGLLRIANKLSLDCAPALVGFEFSSMRCRPVFDGFVVCKEHADILLDAWNQDQDEQRKKSEDKRVQNIRKLWKRAIRWVIAGNRLHKKYLSPPPPIHDPTPSTSKFSPIEANSTPNSKRSRGEDKKESDPPEPPTAKRPRKRL